MPGPTRIMQGDRISRDSDYWDLAAVLKQLLQEDRKSRPCVAGLLGLRGK
jgi:hypothetical protein